MKSEDAFRIGVWSKYVPFALGRCCVRDVGDHEEQKTGKVDGAAHVVGHLLQLGRCALDTEALHDSAAPLWCRGPFMPRKVPGKESEWELRMLVGQADSMNQRHLTPPTQLCLHDHQELAGVTMPE